MRSLVEAGDGRAAIIIGQEHGIFRRTQFPPFPNQAAELASGPSWPILAHPSDVPELCRSRLAHWGPRGRAKNRRRQWKGAALTTDRFTPFFDPPQAPVDYQACRSSLGIVSLSSFPPSCTVVLRTYHMCCAVLRS